MSLIYFTLQNNHNDYICLNFPLGHITIPISSIHCDVNINWTEFVQALTRALISPNHNVLTK